MAHAPSINGRFKLPAIPGNTSTALAAHIADYQAAFSDVPNGDERWEAAVAAIDAFIPKSLDDLAAKLIAAIHYRDPCLVDGRWAIGAPEAKCDRLAIEMELACVRWLLDQAEACAVGGVDIEAPFARWKEAWRQSDALGSDAAIEAEIDRCDGEIAANAHLSPRALEIKLWTELAFQFGTEAEHEPLMREDVEGLRAAAQAEPAGADFLELVTLETIEALRRMTPGRAMNPAACDPFSRRDGSAEAGESYGTPVSPLLAREP